MPSCPHNELAAGTPSEVREPGHYYIHMCVECGWVVELLHLGKRQPLPDGTTRPPTGTWPRHRAYKYDPERSRRIYKDIII